MKYFNKFCDILCTVYTALGAVLLVVIFVACILQVFTRYVLGSALPGTEEVSRYSFIWLGFLGSSVCVQNWSNANISILGDALKGNAKKVHSTFLYAMVILCACVLFYQGIQCLFVTSRQLSSMLRIRMSYVYLSIPVGAFGIIVAALRLILNMWIGSNGKEAEP